MGRFKTTAWMGLTGGLLGGCGTPTPPEVVPTSKAPLTYDCDGVQIDTGLSCNPPPNYYSCGSEVPVVRRAEIVDVSSEQEPPSPTFEVRFDEVIDTDGGLHLVDYMLAIDDTIDGRVGDDATGLIATVESDEIRCDVFTTAASFLLPVDDFLFALPERCAEYEVAMSVLDADEHLAEWVFTTIKTPAEGGLPCE